MVLQHESMGPKGGFSYFVFQKLHENKQFSKLLRLGEEFHEELLIFLKEHPELLWLHELFLHQFFSASDTLHGLALSESDGPVMAPEVGTEVESDHSNLELRLADRKRLLYLSKIALMAGITQLWSCIDPILSIVCVLPQDLNIFICEKGWNPLSHVLVHLLAGSLASLIIIVHIP